MKIYFKNERGEYCIDSSIIDLEIDNEINTTKSMFNRAKKLGCFGVAEEAAERIKLLEEQKKIIKSACEITQMNQAIKNTDRLIDSL